MKLSTIFVLSLGIALSQLSWGESPAGKKIAKVKITFGSPLDGAQVQSPLKVVMKAEGINLRPAGEAADEKTSGHHHILIDKESIPVGQPIPADESHIHFGKAQTETEIKLTPGKHKLTLQFADGAHRSYGPEMSQTIEVNVVAPVVK